jgi:hypothetical protein
MFGLTNWIKKYKHNIKVKRMESYLLKYPCSHFDKQRTFYANSESGFLVYLCSPCFFKCINYFKPDKIIKIDR